MILTIELVPKTGWNKNLRSMLSDTEWDRVRRETYTSAGYRCEICGGVGDRHPVECHERWEYDDEKHVQRLVGLVALCPLCHMAKHLGFAEMKGRMEDVAAHMMAVNGWTRDQFEEHRRKAFEVWKKRSARSWAVDTAWFKSRSD